MSLFVKIAKTHFILNKYRKKIIQTDRLKTKTLH